ncbi:MAG: lipopolysaccharide heptosyltransferase II [Sedimentisphaerales bacterium]|nr:lipopolysaccharide heptosyltransferase II [Sedimentisphaerales bacterium]
MTAPSQTQMQNENILIWLPSPMGDAILATPALRAIREHYKDAKITFLASDVVRDVLSPCPFNDEWLTVKNENPLKLASEIKKYNFSRSILFKNSFGSALTVFLAGIKNRIGYSRDGRGLFLTEKLYPQKLSNGKFRPQPMLDYYLSIASALDAETNDRELKIDFTVQDESELKDKLPEVFSLKGPLIILVPGGAFGPSKCWPAERFAQTADRLIENHNAKVIISVTPNEAEKEIANKICSLSKNELINLADNPLSIGELKVLFSFADLVICNDTGPRHIATAFGRKVITMYGPNEPVWTQTGYENEIHIVGKAPCAPCLKPNCDKKEHICMESITAERVCHAADMMLKNKDFSELSDYIPQFEELSHQFFIEKNYIENFKQAGLTDFDKIFSFKAGENLKKENLAGFRSRRKFRLNENSSDLYLKRYNKPPLDVQLDKWLCNHWSTTCGQFEFNAADKLNKAGTNTAKVVAFGWENDLIFEKRSFIISEQIQNAVSLEQKLPVYFDEPDSKENLIKRRNFTVKLAEFIKRFHATGFRHRDLYLCHIFCDDNENFTLIDLARAFKPILLVDRFQIKDISQLFYSAPAKYFSRTDRLRFYKIYTGHKKLTGRDEEFISAVLSKVKQMARHDRKHDRIVPYKDIK